LLTAASESRAGCFGDFQVSARAATHLENPVDACLITVTNTQLKEALRRALPNAVGEGLVVPFLNGI
jgi:2-dehydropantoate 2-reductase